MPCSKGEEKPVDRFQFPKTSVHQVPTDVQGTYSHPGHGILTITLDGSMMVMNYYDLEAYVYRKLMCEFFCVHQITSNTSNTSKYIKIHQITSNTSNTSSISNTSKHIKTHQNTSKHIKTHQNTSKYIKTHQNTPKDIKAQNTSKHIKTHQNTSKRVLCRELRMAALFLDITVNLNYFEMNNLEFLWVLEVIGLQLLL